MSFVRYLYWQIDQIVMEIKELTPSQKVKELVRHGRINRLELKTMYRNVKNIIFKENTETYK